MVLDDDILHVLKRVRHGSQSSIGKNTADGPTTEEHLASVKGSGLLGVVKEA